MALKVLRPSLPALGPHLKAAGGACGCEDDDFFLDDGSLFPRALDGESDLTPRLFLNSIKLAAATTKKVQKHEGRPVVECSARTVLPALVAARICSPTNPKNVPPAALNTVSPAPTSVSPPPRVVSPAPTEVSPRVRHRVIGEPASKPRDEKADADDAASTASEGSGEGDKTKSMRFPAKLVELLSDSSLADVIRWEPSSRAVILVDQRRFVAEVVPKYFVATPAKSLKSFHRQLNYYGFEVQRRASAHHKTYVNRDVTVTTLDDFHRLLRHRPKKKSPRSRPDARSLSPDLAMHESMAQAAGPLPRINAANTCAYTHSKLPCPLPGL